MRILYWVQSNLHLLSYNNRSFRSAL